jgi:hypothetical protein
MIASGFKATNFDSTTSGLVVERSAVASGAVAITALPIDSTNTILYTDRGASGVRTILTVGAIEVMSGIGHYVFCMDKKSYYTLFPVPL